jgi:hypothetical protein
MKVYKSPKESERVRKSPKESTKVHVKTKNPWPQLICFTPLRGTASGHAGRQQHLVSSFLKTATNMGAASARTAPGQLIADRKQGTSSKHQEGKKKDISLRSRPREAREENCHEAYGVFRAARAALRQPAPLIGSANASPNKNMTRLRSGPAINIDRTGPRHYGTRPGGRVGTLRSVGGKRVHYVHEPRPLPTPALGHLAAIHGLTLLHKQPFAQGLHAVKHPAHAGGLKTRRSMPKITGTPQRPATFRACSQKVVYVNSRAA